jgi:hypothetical protein
MSPAGDVIKVKGFVRFVDQVALAVGLPATQPSNLTVYWSQTSDPQVRQVALSFAALPPSSIGVDGFAPGP